MACVQIRLFYNMEGISRTPTKFLSTGSAHHSLCIVHRDFVTGVCEVDGAQTHRKTTNNKTEPNQDMKASASTATALSAQRGFFLLFLL